MESTNMNNNQRRSQRQASTSGRKWKYPSGFRFVPTDQELVLDYLMEKVNGEPIPVSEMSDVNLYEHPPQYLAEKYPQLGDKEWYFFTPRDRKYPNGNRPSRSVEDVGYWKATGADKPIIWYREEIGRRKALVFYMGKPKPGQSVKTNWIMHEYKLKGPSISPSTNGMRLDDWVLCRIYEKPGKRRKDNIEDESVRGDGVDRATMISGSIPDDDTATMINGGPADDVVNEHHPDNNNNTNAYNNCHQLPPLPSMHIEHLHIHDENNVHEGNDQATTMNINGGATMISGSVGNDMATMINGGPADVVNEHHPDNNNNTDAYNNHHQLPPLPPMYNGHLHIHDENNVREGNDQATAMNINGSGVNAYNHSHQLQPPHDQATTTTMNANDGGVNAYNHSHQLQPPHDQATTSSGGVNVYNHSHRLQPPHDQVATTTTINVNGGGVNAYNHSHRLQPPHDQATSSGGVNAYNHSHQLQPPHDQATTTMSINGGGMNAYNRSHQLQPPPMQEDEIEIAVDHVFANPTDDLYPANNFGYDEQSYTSQSLWGSTNFHQEYMEMSDYGSVDHFQQGYNYSSSVFNFNGFNADFAIDDFLRSEEGSSNRTMMINPNGDQQLRTMINPDGDQFGLMAINPNGNSNGEQLARSIAHPMNGNPSVEQLAARSIIREGEQLAARSINPEGEQLAARSIKRARVN